MEGYIVSYFLILYSIAVVVSVVIVRRSARLIRCVVDGMVW